MINLKFPFLARCTGVDKSGYQVNIFFISLRKHVVVTHETLLMCTHNKCF